MQIRGATEANLPEIIQIYNEVITNWTAIYSEAVN
jgi:L-amino acid N-acyltransferase YncA